MTDTPRTDAHSFDMESEDFDIELAKTYALAWKLERELNDLNEQLHKVRIRCSEWTEVAGKNGAEVDRLRALLDSQNK